MSQPSPSRKHGLLWTTLLLFTAGCFPSEPMQMGQAMAMGPWTFEVERVAEGKERRGGLGELRTVTVTLRLHNYQDRHDQTFDDFMMGRRPGAMMIHPNYRLMSESGATFDALLIPASGGSLRSERWRAKFELADPQNAADAMTDSSVLAARYADLPLADMTFVIENPDPQQGQPRRVNVALR